MVSEKELRSHKENLDVIFKTKSKEIALLDDKVNKANNRFIDIEKEILSSKMKLGEVQDKMKEAQKELHALELKKRGLKSEIDNAFLPAMEKEKRLDNLIKHNEEEAADIQKEKYSVDQAKIQLHKNLEHEKELVKMRGELSDLIVENEAKEEYLKKEQCKVKFVEEDLKRQANVLDVVKKDFTCDQDIIQKKIKDLENKDKTLDELIRAHNKKIKDLDDKNIELQAKINQKNADIAALEERKIGHKRTVDAFELQRSILNSKEARIHAILDKLKKQKDLENDLKSVGL